MLHHSAAVHIPIALAVLFPLGYVTILISVKAGYLPKRIWFLLWGLAGIQIITTGVSYLSGERARALSSGTAELLNQHQNLADSFFVIWLVIGLALPLAFLITKPSLARAIHLLLLVLLAFQFFQAVQLGQAGGQLVFGS